MPAFPPPYTPLAAFCAPARATAEPWRTLAGLAIAVALYLLGLRSLTSMILGSLGPLGGMLTLQEIAMGATPFGVTVLLYTYLPLTGGLALAIAVLMDRGLFSLIGPWPLAWRSFVWVALPLLALAVCLMPLQVMAENVGRHLGLGAQALWLPLALPGLMIQTGTEELIFRGYLQQQLAARSSRPMVWMALPAAVFAVLHWAPQDYGAAAGLVVLWAFAFGLATADLTARTGNIGAALGLHFAINAQGLLLVGSFGHLHGLALYNLVLPFGDDWAQLPYLAVDSAMLLVGWLTARLILRV